LTSLDFVCTILNKVNLEYRIQETGHRIEKAEIRKSGYKKAGYQNIRESRLNIEYIIKNRALVTSWL